MKTKPAFIITFAREVIVDACWSGRVWVLRTVDIKQLYAPLAGSSGPEPKLGKDAGEDADAELQDHLRGPDKSREKHL